MTRVISRPIAELDASIRQLGSADFAQPIRVGGPQDLRALGARLDWLRRRLTELEAQKNRFLRHLSHELKTPLASLREGAELLNDQVAGPLAPPQRAVVSIMRDHSVKLQKLTEELLDYQRALHAAASLEVKPVRLDTLVREVVEAQRLSALAKELRVVLEVAAVQVDADPEKLRSIVDNLMGNALRYGRGLMVTVELERGEGGLTVQVLDRGPGIPAEELEAVFRPFYRLEHSRSADTGGSGRGLAIARQLADANDWLLALGSREGGGTVAELVLPAPPRGASRCAAAPCLQPTLLVPAGNRLPGVPSYSGDVEANFRTGWADLKLEWRVLSSLPVDDRNSDAAGGDGIVNVALARTFNAGALKIRAFLRNDNVLDARYIGSVIVNEANGRYFESAPGRAWLTGLDLRY